MLTTKVFDSYFPNEIPPLVGRLWAAALQRAEIDVAYASGRLWLDEAEVEGLEAPPGVTSTISGPAEALEIWRTETSGRLHRPCPSR